MAETTAKYPMSEASHPSEPSVVVEKRLNPSVQSDTPALYRDPDRVAPSSSSAEGGSPTTDINITEVASWKEGSAMAGSPALSETTPTSFQPLPPRRHYPSTPPTPPPPSSSVLLPSSSAQLTSSPTQPAADRDDSGSHARRGATSRTKRRGDGSLATAGVTERSEVAPVPWAVTSATSGHGVDYSTSMRLGLPCSAREEVLLAECATRPRLEEEEEAREKRWHEWCRGVPLLAGAAPSTVVSLRQLARRPRQGGIPRSLRSVMWLTLTGMAQKLDENEYFCAWLLRRNGYVTGKHAQAIAADLERTFPGHPYFSDKDVGLYKLRNLLHALCWRNPLLNYCQSFNYIAALLLLVFDDEEKAFWMLTYILETLLPNDYFEENLTGTRVDQAVFEFLVKGKLPRLARHLATLHNFEIGAVLPPWVMSLYVNTFPPETTLRVWDYMFTESECIAQKTAGHLEVALAVLKLNETVLMQSEDAGDVMEALRFANEAMFDADTLIQTARSMAVTPTELHALRRRLKPVVAQEIRQREEQRAWRAAQRVAVEEQRRLAKQASTRSFAPSPSTPQEPTPCLVGGDDTHGESGSPSLVAVDPGLLDEAE